MTRGPSLRAGRLLALVAVLLGVFLPQGCWAVVERFSPEMEKYDHNGHCILAQTMSQIKAQIANDIMQNPQSFYRNPESLRKVLRALYHSPKVMTTHRRHSDRSFESHLIGTASCAIAVNLDPAVVAAVAVHGLYIKHWDDPARGWSNGLTPCELRQKVLKFLDPDAERLLWLFTGLLGHGPSQDVMFGIYETLQSDPSQFSAEDKQLILATLCDEFDEHIAGEQWWSDNFKKRTPRSYSAMIETARLLGSEPLAKIGEAAFHSTQALFPVGKVVPVATEERQSLRQAVTLINEAAQAIGDKRKGTKFTRTALFRGLYRLYVDAGTRAPLFWNETRTMLEAVHCQGADDPGAETRPIQRMREALNAMRAV